MVIVTRLHDRRRAELVVMHFHSLMPFHFLAGIVCPPIRALCMPTLHQPQRSCPREKCTMEYQECPGNCWEAANGQYTLVWRHYKNADRGGYVGDSQIVRSTPKVTSDMWQRLFHHWVTWARREWLELSMKEESEVPYTFTDARGEPFRSPEHETGTNLSIWIRPTLIQIMAEAGTLDERQMASMGHFTLQVPRFSFVQMMDKRLKGSSLNAGEILQAKENICKCMMSSSGEWDTYAKRKDHTEDMEDIAEWMRSMEHIM